MRHLLVVALTLVIGICKAYSQNNNARLETLLQPKIDTLPEAQMIANASFRQLAGKEWKLDQMYIDSLPVSDTAFANIKLLFVYPRKFVWARTINGQEIGKDYPVKFVFSTYPPSSGVPKIDRLELYHKYNPSTTPMYTYYTTYVSDKILVLTSYEANSNSSGDQHTVEYRFLSLP